MASFIASQDNSSPPHSYAEDTGKQRENSANKVVPPDIEFSTVVEAIDFHPSNNFIASGKINGDVTVHSYDVNGKNYNIMLFCHHKRACRAVKFSHDGNILFTASRDKSIAGIDVDYGRLLTQKMKAHKSRLYSLLPIDNFLLVSGDEDGVVKLWDYRRQYEVMQFHDCDEYISEFTTNQEKKIVVAASGEGTLTAYNIRAKRMEAQTELNDAEFQNVSVIKNGTKVLTGSSEGVINIFNWGEWGNLVSRFPLKCDSIESMIPISETVVCAGTIDGDIHAVSINPNWVIDKVGSHSGFAVEGLSKSHDGNLLASISVDEKIKFWDISDIEDPVEGVKKKDRKKIRKQKKAATSDNFFADL